MDKLAPGGALNQGLVGGARSCVWRRDDRRPRRRQPSGPCRLLDELTVDPGISCRVAPRLPLDVDRGIRSSIGS
jgi:hypothetical protein